MSFSAYRWAREVTTGSSAAKACLLALADRLNSDTGKCCPSIPTLMKDTEIRSKNTIRTALALLEEKGLIQKTLVTRPNQTTYISYSLPFAPKSEKSFHFAIKEEGSIIDPQGSAIDQGRGQPLTWEGSAIDPEPIKEPITTNTHTTNAHAAVPADSAVDDSQKAIKPKAAKPKKVKQAIECPEGVDKGLFDEVNSVRKFKRQPPFTERTWGFFVRSAGDAGLSVDDVLKICVERSWASFRADWLKDSDKRNQPASDPTQDIFK